MPERRANQPTRHLLRPIMIHICKDGTISYRHPYEPVFNLAALPVFSVSTVQQAKDIQVMFGVKQYIAHPDMPGQPWYRWTNFSGEVEALEDVTHTLVAWWDKYHAMDEAAAMVMQGNGRTVVMRGVR